MRGVGDTIIDAQMPEGEPMQRWAEVFVDLMPIGTKDEVVLRNLQAAADTPGRRLAIRPSPDMNGAVRISLVVGVCALSSKKAEEVADSG